MSRERRDERRQSAARRRSETHSTDYQNSCWRLPEGVKIFTPKAGVVKIDILPFKAAKTNPYADEGEDYFERTFWVWSRIGVDENSYCCLHKTFGEKDPVEEWKKREARNPDADQKYLSDLRPKERQLFLLSETSNPGLKLWDVSHFLFGKLLDSRIKNSLPDDGWDWFYMPTTEGKTLRIEIEEKQQGTMKWVEVTAIDFLSRESSLPKELVNHGICLDDLLIKKKYEELNTIFMGGEDSDQPASPRQRGKDGEKSTSGGSEKSQTDRQESKRTETTKRETEKSTDERPKTLPVASDFNLSRGDEVKYKGKIYTLLKISGDGTSLTLTDEEDDTVLHAIGPEEVSKIVTVTTKRETETEKPKEQKTEKAEKPKEQKAEKPKATDDDKPLDDDDDWDY